MLPSYFCFSMPFILFAFHSDTETLLWVDVVSMFLLRLLKLAIWYLNRGIIQPREYIFCCATWLIQALRQCLEKSFAIMKKKVSRTFQQSNNKKVKCLFKISLPIFPHQKFFLSRASSSRFKWLFAFCVIESSRLRKSPADRGTAEKNLLFWSQFTIEWESWLNFLILW